MKECRLILLMFVEITAIAAHTYMHAYCAGIHVYAQIQKSSHTCFRLKVEGAVY
jgi:hypothetical protein